MMRFCWPQLTFIAVVLILGISSMLSACGKKGPLYLPQQKTDTSQAAPSETKPAAQDKTSAQPASTD